jgi:hypothetical protein
LTAANAAGPLVANCDSKPPNPPDSTFAVHFDLHVASAAEQEAEEDRLTSLGAVRVDWDRYPDDPDFIVLADTEGNRFCIVDLGHQSRESG